MLNRIYSYFFNKANTLRSQIAKKEGESPWRVKTFAALYLFAVEIMEDFLKLLILLFKNPYDSFQLFTKQETLPICEYSYSDHKRFKKKVQLFSAAGISSIVAIALILNIILSLVVPGQLPSYAKTVNGGWDDWSLTNLAGDPPSGSAGTLTIDPADSAEISGTGTASDLRLKSSSYTATDDETFSTTGSATELGTEIYFNQMTIAAGTTHTVGLKNDGTVVATAGGGDVSSWTDIKAISAGATHTVGLKNDGTVVATAGGGDVSSWTDIKAISAGAAYTVGLKNDGTVVAVGNNTYGQLNVTGWTDIKSIAAGQYHTVGLKDNGTVVAVGLNNRGQTNVTGWMNIKAIATGLYGTVGLKNDGTVVALGSNAAGELNVTGWTDIKAIDGGGSDSAAYTVGLKNDGTVVAVGNNTYGQLNVTGWTDIKAVSARDYHTVGLKNDGTVVAVGLNTSDQLNVTGWTDIRQPTYLSFGSGTLTSTAISGSGTAASVGLVFGAQIGSNISTGGNTGHIAYDSTQNVVWSANVAPYNVLQRFDAATGAQIGSNIAIGNGTKDITYDFTQNAVWVVAFGVTTMKKFDAATGAQIGSDIPILQGSQGITYDSTQNAVWVLSFANDTLKKFDAATGAQIGSDIPTADGPQRIAYDSTQNAVWVTNWYSNTLQKFDAATGAQIGSNISTSVNPFGIAYDSTQNAVWVTNNSSNTLQKFDAATGAQIGSNISTGVSPLGIAYDSTQNAVWVTNNSSNTLQKFDAATGAQIGSDILTFAGNIIYDSTQNAVWVTNNSSNTLQKFDARGYSPSGTFESATIDLGGKASLGNLDYTSTIPSQTQTSCTVSTGEGCALKFQVATSDSSSGPWTYYGPDGETNTYFTTTGTAIPSALSGKQYFRYKAYLATADTNYTPTLDSVTLNYSQYPSSSTVTNLKFNSGYTGLTWSSVSWAVSNPSDISSSVKVKAQARVAASDTALASATFAGYDGTNTNDSTYFDFYGSGQTNCSEAVGKFGDGDASKKTYTCQIDQTDTVYLNKADPDKTWLELKLVLEGDIYRTPQIDAARASYAINNEPEICVKLTDDTTCDTTVTSLKKIVEPSPYAYLDVAQDQSDQYGNVIFDAYLRDPDTNTGTVENQGFVYVGIEYTDSSGAFGNATDSIIPPVSPSTLYYDATGAAGKGRFATATNLTITPQESGFDSCELTGWTDYRAGFRYKCPVYVSTPDKYARYTFKWKVGNYDENGTFSGDFQDLALASNFKIRLVTYDGEGANSINSAARSVSNGFTADTKKPAVVVNSTVINAAPATSGSGTIGWLPSVTDDNTMQYKLSDDGATWSASWSNYSATILHDFAESTDRTTTLYYRLKDAYGNETAPASVTTLQRPHNLTLIDVSNIKGDDPDFYSYANFISWNLVENPLNRFNSYIVYRCIRDEATNPADYCDEKTNYSIINTGQNTALSTNSFTDYLSSEDKEKLIYYRVASKDNNGNISGWLAGGTTTSSVYGKANGLLDYGEGGGGSDGEPPKIMTAPSFTNIAQTSANVIWTTDELATGGVFYSKNSTNYNLEKSTLAYQTTGYDATTDPSGRTIALTGLDASSIYNIRLKSVDASGNITICDSATDASQATDSVTGRVTYINQSGYCPSGATESTYQFETLEKDVTPPVISAVTISDVDHESAKIVWTTDENSDSCVSFDTATADRTYGSGQCASGQIKSHTVTLAGLTASTTYYIKVKSQDSEKNLADKCSLDDNTDCPSIGLTDANYAFTTLVAPPPEVVVISSGGGGGARGKQDFTAPLISGITVADITDQSATVAWTTDEKSSSFVQYGESENLLNTTGGQLDEVLSHKVVLKGLKPETKYFFKATSVDWAGNIGSSSVLNFTTEKAPSVEEEISKISGIEAQEKTKEVLEKLEEQIKAQKDDIVDPLQALLDALSPFINEPIIIGESPEIEVNSTTASIKWRTDKKSTSFVALAREDEFDDKAAEPYKQIVGNPDDSVKEHKVEITGLLPATRYHYQVRSKALIGDTSRSKDFTFTTKSELPQVVSFLQKKTENEKTAVIYWETSVPTDSVVKYTPYVQGKLNPKQSKIQGKPDMVTSHEITLTNLDPGTIYQIEVSGRDPFANATAKILPDFTTAIDKDAPVISQVRIESAMISGKTPKIQTIVSFRTDEPATSQVSFVEGGEENFKQLPPNLAFATTHTFVITDFKPASIYRIRVEAIDESGNLAVSRDFTILTPAQSQSIIDIIVKTFENTFGWVKNVRF